MTIGMSDAAEPLDVFFDESGFTGPKLLDPAQPYFTYASVEVTDAEAWSILSKARVNNPVQMPELKASKLLATAAGTALVTEVITAVEGRYTFVVQDKLLVLCGKVFEYIFEPVMQPVMPLLYAKGLHRFVAMYCFIFFIGPEGERSIRQFEDFMRSLDPAEAPLLFDPARLDDIDDEDPFKMVVRFAQGHRDVIVDDNQRMRREMSDEGKWALDVSIAGLWSLLNHWGERKRPLNVTCDDSKPLRDQVGWITGGADDPGIRRAREMRGRDGPLGWELARPIDFGDSRNHPALQIADLIAGVASRMPQDASGRVAEGLQSALMRHIHKHSIMPDFDVVALGAREVDVNWLALMELGDRARRGADPCLGLAEFYHAAEASWRPDILGDGDDGG